MSNKIRSFLFICIALAVLLAGVQASAMTLTLPASVQSIETEAFYGDTSLDEVILPEGIRTIGARAFADSSVTLIHLPESLTFIASDAFSGCADIHAEVYDGSYAQLICESRGIPYRVIYPVTGISLNKVSTSIARGGTEKLIAEISPSNATDPSVTWSSSKPAVATVDTEGTVTAVSAGVAVITATSVDGGLTDTCTVTVFVPAEGITLNKMETTVARGSTETLLATVLPQDATDHAVTWASSDSNVAAVDQEGKVEALAAGTAVITAATADGSFTAACTVTVVVPVSSVQLDKTVMTLYVYRDSNETVTLYNDSTDKLTADVLPIDATDRSVIWSSSAPAIAEVTQDGTVTAVSRGTAVIKATSADGRKTASCTVTVNNGTLRFITQPEDTVVERGRTAVFSVEAALADEFVWQRRAGSSGTWSAFSFGDTDGRFNTLTLAGTDENATYQYRCRISDENGFMVHSVPVTLTVTDILVSGITLNGSSDQPQIVLNLNDNKTTSIQWAVTPADATLTDLTWTSSDDSIVTVQNTHTTGVTGSNVITAVGGGQATITVRSGSGAAADCSVTVNNSVSLNPASVSGGAPGGTSYSVAVTADGPWTVQSDSSWLTLSSASGTGNGTIQAMTAKNTTGAARTGMITVTCGSAVRTFTVTQNPYSLTLNPTEQGGVSENGASYTVTVTADGPWTAASGVSWLSVSPASGTGNGAITVTAAANTNPTSRANNIVVDCGGVQKTYRLHQRAYFTLSLSKTSATGGNPDGGTDTVNVTNNAAWTAASDSSWLTISPASGSSGTTKVTVTYAKNTTTAARTGKVTFTCGDSNTGTKTVTYTLTQNAHGLAINPATQTNVSPDGAAYTVTVTANGTWTASSNASWLTLSTASGSGNGSFKATAAKNNTIAARTATVTVTCGTASATYTLTQNKHTVTVSPASQTNASPDGASYTVTVTANGAWTASSNASWLTLSATSGSGNGSFKATVAKNNTTAARTATVTVTCGTASATYTLTQNKHTVTVSPASQTNVSPDGASYTVTVTANGAWTASSNASWLTLSATSGSGNGSFKATVAKNNTTAARNATVTVTCGTAKATYSLSQNKYSISVSPTSQSGVSASGGSYTTTVTSSAGWTASSNASWLTVSPVSGSNGAKPTIKAAANTATSSRTGTITFTCGNTTATYTLTQVGKATPTPVPATPTPKPTATPTPINPGLTSLSTSKYAITKTRLWQKYYDLYTTKELTTKLGSDKWTGEDDTIWIVGVGRNSSGTPYAYVKYPASSDTPNTFAYMPLTAFVTGTLTNSKQATSTVVGRFTEWWGGTYFPSDWEITRGDTVYLLEHSNGWWQVMYPAGSLYRIVWCTDATYNALFSTTPSSLKEQFVQIAEREADARHGASYYGFSDDWCARFVSWCADQANVPSNQIVRTALAGAGVFSNYGAYGKIYYFEYTTHMQNAGDTYIPNKGIQVSRSTFTPERGDLIFFNWNDSSSDYDHVAIVYAADASNVYYIDGNGGSGTIYTRTVQRRSRSKTDTQIVAYYRPW